MREAEDYCKQLGVEYNPKKIIISTTDYGKKVVLWYDTEENE